MNPFQLIPVAPDRGPLPADEDGTWERMIRLREDLTALAGGIEAGGWGSVAIVQTPQRLQISGQVGDSVTPLLAMALLADLERTVAAAEIVRDRLSPAWRSRLIG